MKRILCIVLVFSTISTHYCFCQNDYTSGYIINNLGDTIFGFIDNRDSKSNSMLCYFKKDETGESEKYSPQELLGYRYTDGNFFISKNITIEGIEKPAFLEFMVQGKINLYHYKDKTNEHLYFVEKEGRLYELKNTIEIGYNEKRGRENTIEKNEYIGVLTYLMQDANMQNDIDECICNREYLTEIVKKYHEKVCSDEKCIVYEKVFKPVHVAVGIEAGISFNKFDYYGLVVSNYGLGKILGLKIELENVFDWNENLSIVSDINLQNLTNYSLSVMNDVENFEDRTVILYENKSYALPKINSYDDRLKMFDLNVNLKTFLLKIPIVINYTLSKGKIKPYVGFGIQNNFVISQNKNLFFQERYYHIGESSFFSNKPIPFYQIGFVGRVGAKYTLKNKKSIFLEVNYETINRMLSTTLGYFL